MDEEGESEEDCESGGDGCTEVASDEESAYISDASCDTSDSDDGSDGGGVAHTPPPSSLRCLASSPG